MNYHIKYLVESFIDDEEETHDIELTSLLEKDFDNFDKKL